MTPGQLLLGVGSAGVGAAGSTHADSYQGKYTSGPAGLLALWRLNETAGTEAAAIPDNDYHGRYQGPTLNSTTAPGGGAAPSFDGVNDWVRLTSNFSSDGFTTLLPDNFLGTSGTFCGWGSNTSKDAQEMATFHDTSTATFSFRGYTSASGTISIIRTCGGVTDDVLVTGAGDLSTWYHLAVTWDESDDLMKVYLDGTSIGSTTGLGAWTASSLTTAFIGSAANFSRDWNGHIANVALWNVSLTAAQIADFASTTL